MARGREILLCSFAEREVMHKEKKSNSFLKVTKEVYIKEQMNRNHVSYTGRSFSLYSKGYDQEKK